MVKAYKLSATWEGMRTIPRLQEEQRDIVVFFDGDLDIDPEQIKPKEHKRGNNNALPIQHHREKPS